MGKTQNYYPMAMNILKSHNQNKSISKIVELRLESHPQFIYKQRIKRFVIKSPTTVHKKCVYVGDLIEYELG